MVTPDTRILTAAVIGAAAVGYTIAAKDASSTGNLNNSRPAIAQRSDQLPPSIQTELLFDGQPIGKIVTTTDQIKDVQGFLTKTELLNNGQQTFTEFIAQDGWNFQIDSFFPAIHSIVRDSVLRTNQPQNNTEKIEMLKARKVPITEDNLAGLPKGWNNGDSYSATQSMHTSEYLVPGESITYTIGVTLDNTKTGEKQVWAVIYIYNQESKSNEPRFVLVEISQNGHKTVYINQQNKLPQTE